MSSYVFCFAIGARIEAVSLSDKLTVSGRA
jgi:hypothetical protein